MMQLDYSTQATNQIIEISYELHINQKPNFVIAAHVLESVAEVSESNIRLWMLR